MPNQTPDLQRVAAQVADALAEDARTNALWSRIAVLGVDTNQLTQLVRGYVESIPAALSALETAASDPADGVRVRRLLDTAVNAFLSTPGLPGESGVIGLLGNAYLVWQLFSLAAKDDPEPLAPALVTAHQVIASMLGPALIGRQDQIATSLFEGMSHGSSPGTDMAPGSFAVGLTRQLPPPRVVSITAVSATPPSVRTNVFAEGASSRVLAGGLDPGFGRGGLVVTSVREGDASGLVVQVDGSLVVAGKCRNDAGTRSVLLARYTLRGNLDVGFARSGCMRLDRSYGSGAPVDCAAAATAVQQDGRIVVAGGVRQPPEVISSFDDMFVARVTADGQLDASFGREGWLQLDAGMASAAHALLIEPDGRILVSGFVRDVKTGTAQACLLGLTPEGRMSRSLGATGLILLPSDAWGEAVALARQADGKIVVLAKEMSGANNKFTVWRVATEGRPDPSFGDGGRITLDLGGGSNEPRALAIQRDGKLLVAGYLQTREYVVVRVDGAGRVDPTFGEGGVVRGLYEPPSPELQERHASFGAALAVQEDGAILLGGAMTQKRVQTGYVGSMPMYDIDRVVALARFLPDGRLDPGFGRDGTSITDVSDGIDALAALGLHGGRVFGAGVSARGLLVACFHRDTSSPTMEAAPAPQPSAPRRWLDPSFQGGGAAITSFPNGPADARAIALHPDGRIVVAGRVGDPDSPEAACIAAARYERDGALDGRFASGGRKLVDIEGASSEAHAVAIQVDGKIVIAGSVLDRKGAGRDFALVRLDPDGRVDLGFGGGLVATGFGESSDGVAHAVAARPDGKIVAVGYAADAEGAPGPEGELRKERFVVARYESDGRLDESFGRRGVVTTGFRGDLARAEAVHLLTNGRILAAGFARDPAKEYGWDLAVVRYRDDGSLDESFGDGGRVLVDVEKTNDFVHAITVQPDGKIVIAGAASDPAGGMTRFLLARLDAAGRLDPSFGDGGILIVNGVLGAAAAVALLADGRMVAAGRAIVHEREERTRFAIACCLADGRLDPAFGTKGMLLVDLGGVLDGANGIAVQEDGKILAAGTTRGGAVEFAVIRVQRP
jgi:uncharacterized delta-60 repeat protein